MTDNRPFTPSEVDELDAELHGWPLIASLPRDEALRLMATLRAALADLATARAVTRRLLDGWKPKGSVWRMYAGAGGQGDMPMTDAERAWLASVVSPPTNDQNEGRNT